jgi:hypothetical protein
MKAWFRHSVAWLLDYLEGRRPVWWAVVGYVTAYLLLFALPIFLNSDRVMLFPQYVPIEKPIGYDLHWMLRSARSWLSGRFEPDFHPPLTWLTLAPLASIDPDAAFAMVTGITFLSYLVLTAGIPVWMNPGRLSTPMLVLMLVSGLSSYGLHFEVERGQYSVFAMTLTMLAVWLVHFHRRWRWIAYALFTVAVQIKLFPAIFILALVRDWRDWRTNLKLLLGLGMLNFALLFVFGTKGVQMLLEGLTSLALPGMPWRGNHSIHSFVVFTIFVITDMKPGVYSWLRAYSEAIQAFLSLLVAGLLALTAVMTNRQPGKGPSGYLLLACTLAALLIPSVSNDYRLAMLAGPAAIVLCREGFTEGMRGRRLPIGLLVLLFSLAYSSTLFSFTNKPLLLENNLPALMIMLIVTAVWALMDRGGAQEPSGAEA